MDLKPYLEPLHCTMGTTGNATAATVSAPDDAEWEARARRSLASDNARARLNAYGLLSEKCTKSKELQNQIGALLREPIAAAPAAAAQATDATANASDRKKRLLEILFADLQSEDRTLRLASTRLICQVAYENLLNQDAFMQLSNGFSVGWMHVFAIPGRLRRAYEAQCAETQHAPSRQGLVSFLRQVVIKEYAPVYHAVSMYYASDCRGFLPLCWHYPPAMPAISIMEGTDLPDPAEHLVGFFLVPRQTQFPEHDEYFTEEMVQSMDKDDLRALQNVKTCFSAACASVDTNTNAAPEEAKPTKPFEERYVDKIVLWATIKQHAQVQWLLEPIEGVASLFDFFIPRNEDNQSNPPTQPLARLSWRQVLVYSCLWLNMKKLRPAMEQHGGYALLVKTFRANLWNTRDRLEPLTAWSFVWEPVLIAHIQQQTEFSSDFKRVIGSTQRGLHRIRSDLHDSSNAAANKEQEPVWQCLLRLRLEQIHPLSWAYFVAKWRRVDENQKAMKTQPDHVTTVCSIPHIRKSILDIHPRSFQNLDRLRDELPQICRSQSTLQMSARSLSVATNEPKEEDGEEEEPEQDSPEGTETERIPPMRRRKTTLSVKQQREADAAHAANLAMFHKMQESITAIDELTRQELELKQIAKRRILDLVADNKRRAAAAAARRKQALEERHRHKLEKLEELQHRKARIRRIMHQKQHFKQEYVHQRKERIEAMHEARTTVLMEQLQHEQEAFKRQMEVKQQQQSTANVQAALNARKSQEEPAALPSRPKAPPPSSRRPMSARGTISTAAAEPEMARQRALVYGQVVAKIYVAEAAKRAPTTVRLQRPQSARQYSMLSSFRPQSFRSAKLCTSSSMVGFQGRSSMASTMRERMPLPPDVAAEKKEVGTATLLADEMASTTLVMRNAALAVSDRTSIPDIPAPTVEDPHVPPYVIAAQYSALTHEDKKKFRERFNLKRVSHRLSYEVLKQFTKMVRRDTAWQVFHDSAARANNSVHCDKVKHADFIVIAQNLGITMADKKLLVVARKLDPDKTGLISWKAFYTWWSMQYDDHLLPTR
ncbi:TPA: hypothetical protein N0F65_000691 [Lagenidium giganteum]|uniref:Calmodulin n=1 Tax=Lagenidium giganteum TaxID=4803 RepID=A0AAV2YUL7_9STRA|nr:TPA: hypothetical protein N0F65_000691 [Lagenidium giganteum]